MKSATVTVSRAITVAEGVFAPGHVGELTQVVPFELVDAVLEETGCVQRRLRDLPSRVGVYLVLAMGLFEQVGLAGVWAKLVAGLDGVAVPSPSEKALRDLRRRVGAAPLKALFGVLAGPVARPYTPGVRYRGMRTVAFDGCSSVKVPDSVRNRWRFGKARFAGYPRLMLMCLVETGTRAVIGAGFGPCTGKGAGERAYAAGLLAHLGPGMLVLNDRGFDGNDLLKKIAATKAQFLVRAKASRRPPVLAVLPDGSALVRIGSMTLRMIEARITVRGADGSQASGVYRLLTTLTDHRLDPAPVLIRLYHERWEVESAFFALRHTILSGRVLRSKDPAGIEQEMWALLVLYQAIRTVMVDAAESVPGTDPDRCGFTIALEAARDSVVNARNIVTTGAIDLTGHIGRAVLAGLLPARRERYCARKVKSPISRYHAHTDTDRPLTSTAITGVEIEVCQPPSPKPRAPQPPQAKHPVLSRRTRPSSPRPRARPQADRPPGRWPDVLAVMRTDPCRAWHARDIADLLGDTDNLNSFCTHMSSWSRRGRLRKTAPATYELIETKA